MGYNIYRENFAKMTKNTKMIATRGNSTEHAILAYFAPFVNIFAIKYSNIAF